MYINFRNRNCLLFFLIYIKLRLWLLERINEGGEVEKALGPFIKACWLYENILPDKNNNRDKDNANDEPNFEDRTCPWPYSTNNTTDNYSRGATPPGRPGRKQTLSAHCFRVPTFNSHFPSPRRMTQSNDLRRPGIWLTNCDKRRVRLNAQLLHTALLLRCFPNTQTTLAQPRRQTHALSTPRTFPPIEPAALGADTAALTAARSMTGSGRRQEKRK